MVTDSVESKYLAVLDAIRDMKIAIRRQARERQQNHSKMDPIRAGHVVAIGTEKDAKGKLVYSNERMREAELALRLHKDAKYMSLWQKQLEIDDAIEDLKAEHNRLTDVKYMYMMKLGIPVALDEGDDKLIEFH